jgi:hypothetical protein
MINPATPVAVLDLTDSVLDERKSEIRRRGVHPQLAPQGSPTRAPQNGTRIALSHRDRWRNHSQNVEDAIRAGVEWVVAGSSIFHTVNPGNVFEEMRQIAHEAVLVRV